MASTLPVDVVDDARPRVAVAPADHVYVTRVLDHEAVRLVSAPAEGLVEWLTRSVDDVDVLHLHPGLTGPIGGPEQIVAAAEALDIPLVVTLHEHPDPGDRPNGLGVLCRAAAAVVVHDHADAGVVRQRWDVQAYAHPHPHVADLAAIAASRAKGRRPPWRVGLAPTRADHDDIVRHALWRVVRERDDVEVDAGEPAAEDAAAVVGWVTSLDVLVLPPVSTAPRTWIELARDVGTAVVAPTAPAVVEHGLVVSYSPHGRLPLEVEVTRALHKLWGLLPASAVDVDTRLEERSRVRAAHSALYRAVSAAAGPSTNDEDHHAERTQRNW